MACLEVTTWPGATDILSRKRTFFALDFLVGLRAVELSREDNLFNCEQLVRSTNDKRLYIKCFIFIITSSKERSLCSKTKTFQTVFNDELTPTVENCRAYSSVTI